MNRSGIQSSVFRNPRLGIRGLLLLMTVGTLILPVQAMEPVDSGKSPPAAAKAAPAKQTADTGPDTSMPVDLPPRQQGACTEPGADLAPTMVVLPPGQFLMGAAADDTEADNDERPAHWVTLSRPFAIGLCEVTRRQFAQFVSETGYQTDAEKGQGCRAWNREKSKWEPRSNANWKNPGFDQTDDHPVVCVSYQDAQAYIQWLIRRTGVLYRLPSEAEWEYAARAGTRNPRYWGDRSQCEFANGADKDLLKQRPGVTIADCNDGYPYTAPVGSLGPNSFGLYDMSGNVLEWVADCYHDTYEGAPADGSVWEQTGDCRYRGLRGGSWDVIPLLLRSANRNGSAPDDSNVSVGFRLARAL